MIMIDCSADLYFAEILPTDTEDDYTHDNSVSITLYLDNKSGHRISIILEEKIEESSWHVVSKNEPIDLDNNLGQFFTVEDIVKFREALIRVARANEAYGR